MVRLGRWYVEAYPRCGCDACDERPDEILEEVRGRVAALVARRFSERVRHGLRPTLEHTFEDGGSRTSQLDWTAARRLGPPGTLRWEPWRRR